MGADDMIPNFDGVFPLDLARKLKGDASSSIQRMLGSSPLAQLPKLWLT
eukprot:CAMPEP_0201479672 /NCGR_PEP_ID=MMETSP0151_2-20130828/4338_1 /ASSEMBLY_ACC=CAM_ASM_000257 /TAXON_ID=200890 /ORGANISM="Paramoeba atlantica, Strain 621/1 / CCAP 1560/9" /LENGTH=48 /DNA_ID= /DNA_START= /DNA_END= /DNA_ORIENTATION=